MLRFAYPFLLAALPLPLFIRRLAPPHRESRSCLLVPFLDRLAAHTGQRPTPGAVVRDGSWPRTLALVACWVGSVLALARPQWIEPPIIKTIALRDLLLAVDLSGSMATRDFTRANGEKVDRLTAVKEVLDDFLARRGDDRVGLIFFGSAPFVQAPFTDDVRVCRQLLDEAQPNMAGPQTALGDALGLAINTFARSPVKERVLIVLTDGNDTASKVPPVKAAEIAKNKGIVIHTVAVGDPRAAGEDAFDVETLKSVAAITGGVYSFAADRVQLAEIYRRLDALEMRQAQTVTHHPRRDVYHWPLTVSLVATLVRALVALLGGRGGERVPLRPA